MLTALCGLATLVRKLVFASFVLVVTFYVVERWSDRPLPLLAGDVLAMIASAGIVVLTLQLLIY